MSALVFIGISFDDGWVIEKIAAQLHEAFNRLGVPARIGVTADYRGEPVVFQTRFLYAERYAGALINSVFVTHIDDRLKEAEVVSLRQFVNSFVCMSPEDAAFLRGLGLPADQVIGLDLPLFDAALEPLKLCIFSKRYSDGRKNEQWLLNWTAQNPAGREGLYFSFIGSGWMPVAEELEKTGWSVEVISPGRQLSAEYDIQLRGLRTADAYLYMGFDGGALGSYDAFKAGVPLFVSKTSYHHGIPGVRGLFEDEAQFHDILAGFAREWQARRAFTHSRSLGQYARQLLRHWSELAGRQGRPDLIAPATYADAAPARASEMSAAQATVVYRAQHQPVSVRRALGTAKRFWRRLF